MRNVLALITVGLSAVLLSHPASADALDGDWCNDANGKLTIDGSIIITPKGNRVMGDYSRHRFEYKAPEPGWNGGKVIIIQQFSDTRMQLTVEGEIAQEWKPCQVIS